MTPAPLVAAAALPVAQGAAQGAVKVLTTDIATVKTRYYRQVKVRVPHPTERTKRDLPKMVTLDVAEPVDIELHLHPVGIGIGAAGLGIAALVGIVAWNGIPGLGIAGIAETREGRARKTPTTGIPGVDFITGTLERLFG